MRRLGAIAKETSEDTLLEVRVQVGPAARANEEGG